PQFPCGHGGRYGGAARGGRAVGGGAGLKNGGGSHFPSSAVCLPGGKMRPDPIFRAGGPAVLLPEETRVLDRLVLEGGPRAAEPAPGGARRVRARGADLEFHEYRPYQSGDDPRSIDWNVEARL